MATELKSSVEELNGRLILSSFPPLLQFHFHNCSFRLRDSSLEITALSWNHAERVNLQAHEFIPEIMKISEQYKLDVQSIVLHSQIEAKLFVQIDLT
jgi:hypothetical protein